MLRTCREKRSVSVEENKGLVRRSVIEAGEVTLIYRDGPVEAHRPNGEMFGFPKLGALAAEHGEESSLGDFILKELYSFVGEGWEHEDDITLLTLRIS
jgi:serine phosphatase RsbU (regulator of sigma subunit)